jgi:N utilization substance protein B
MQTLYAHQQAVGANALLAIDQIADRFLPDLNSMEKQDLPQLESLKKEATQYFSELLKNPAADKDITPKAKKIAKEVFDTYVNQNKQDQKNFFRIMLNEPKGIHNLYLKILLMLTELADEAVLASGRKVYDETSETLVPTHYSTAIFDQNRLIQDLKNDAEFKSVLIREQITWDADRLMLREFFKDVIVKDETFELYCKAQNHTAEEDRKIIWHVFNALILRSPITDSYFEDRNFLWAENEDIIKGIVKKTVKSQEDGVLRLQPLSPTWEDDQYFFEDLFRLVKNNEAQYEAMLVDQLQNWDIERVTMIDEILLKMGLAEMINFPGIPTKVSINEFIDLAKVYSTDKSGQFLNGVLDNLSIKLQKEGIIRKSGRGLIDNK